MSKSDIGIFGVLLMGIVLIGSGCSSVIDSTSTQLNETWLNCTIDAATTLGTTNLECELLYKYEKTTTGIRIIGTDIFKCNNIEFSTNYREGVFGNEYVDYTLTLGSANTYYFELTVNNETVTWETIDLKASIIYPEADETLDGFTPFTVKWAAEGNDNVKVKIEEKSGAYPVNQSVQNDGSKYPEQTGSYTLTIDEVADIASGQAKIYIITYRTDRDVIPEISGCNIVIESIISRTITITRS